MVTPRRGPDQAASASSRPPWFTAFALRSAVDMRIVGLAEVVYSYAVSRRLYKEQVSGLEVLGMGLVLVGIVVVSLGP